MNQQLKTLASLLSCVESRGDQHTEALIKENSATATLKKITLLAGNGNWFVFAPDRTAKGTMSPLLCKGNGHNHHCACDAVVVVLKDGKWFFIFVELKSAAEPRGFVPQFQSTRQFTSYLRGLLQEFHNITPTPIEERFVVLCGGANKPRLNKQTTIPKMLSLSSSTAQQPHKQPASNDARIYLKQWLA